MSEINAGRRARILSLSRATLVVYWLAMFVATHWPNFHLDAYPRNTDKLLHLVGYAGLGLLIATYLSARRDLGLRAIAGIVVVVFAYAIVDELLQIPVGRSCDAFDALADLLGCAIGLALFIAVRRTVRRFAAA